MSFDKDAINHFYKLPNYDINEYSTYVRWELDMTDVLQTIARLRAEWKVTSNEFVTLKSSEQSRDNKAWIHFIEVKLIPVSHTSNIRKERAILLYAILSSNSIDVRKVI